MLRKNVLGFAWVALVAVIPACSTDGGGDGPESPPCDTACQDGVAMRALRETMKLVFNVALQGKPVGTYDVSLPCAKGGSARIFGTATAELIQGATSVELTYVLDKCAYLQRDTQPKATFAMTFSGTLVQRGTLAAQSAATTGLVIIGENIVMTGTVYDPAIGYEATCNVFAAQNGNFVSGTLCDRDVGFSF